MQHFFYAHNCWFHLKWKIMLPQSHREAKRFNVFFRLQFSNAFLKPSPYLVPNTYSWEKVLVKAHDYEWNIQRQERKLWTEILWSVMHECKNQICWWWMVDPSKILKYFLKRFKIWKDISFANLCMIAFSCIENLWIKLCIYRFIL